ncbi:MAG: hypothetical protein ACKOK7_01680 [Solirubrobacterales bacterium]
MRNRAKFLTAFALSGLLIAPSAMAQAPSAGAAGACPQFRGMHNDRIGSVKFPAGPYNMVTSQLSCSQSTKLFQQFLDIPSGKLPSPWKLSLLSGGRRRFTKVGTKVDFQATPAAEPTPTPSPSGHTCPGPFRVLHNDRIGKMSVPAGTYTISLLNTDVALTGLTCPVASSDFKYFLDYDYSDPLPSPWYTNPSTKTFYRGTNAVGFRIKRIGN